MIFDGFDVVVTPFPFADRRNERKRPALVLSEADTFGRTTGVAVIAMITTGRASRWPFDVPVTDLKAAGLHHSCVVRMKFATIDFRRVGPKLGTLSARDSQQVAKALRRMLPIASSD